MTDLKKEYRKIFITADYHCGHSNILRICNRPFANIYEHDMALVRNSNALVSNEDLLINLGDVGYKCSAKYISETLKKFTCKRMMVFLGNHDKSFIQACKDGMFDDMFASGKLEVVGGKAAIDDPSLSTSKMVEIGGQFVWLSHYSYRTWPRAFRGAIMLHGHSHGNLPELPKTKCFDVGVDVWKYFPVSFDSIIKKAKEVDTNGGLSQERPNGFEDGTELYKAKICEFNDTFA